MEIKRKKIFNPNGSDDTSKRKIIGGNTTNLFNLNNIKYSWTSNMYRVMMANFWIPEKVDLSEDVEGYQNLTGAEVKAFDGILSFLTFLDSVQTNNLPNVSAYITAPEISTVLAIQTYQEAIHSQSYAYIIESIIPSSKREKIYDLWRDDKVLYTRNKTIAKIYQDFMDEETDNNFIKVLLANYLLEGLYFYNGFMFFYNLASRNKMLGVVDEIKYINRDELTHIVLFQNILKDIMTENPELVPKKLVYELFEKAVSEEIEWSNHILGENIVGITKNTIEKYTKYLANDRLKALGFEPLYPNYTENPYKHLEIIADIDGTSVKAAFFESTNTNYTQSSGINGWDKF